MKRKACCGALMGLAGFLISLAAPAQAERRRRRPRGEVVAWTADATLVVFTEPRRRSRRLVDLVARRVPSGKILARRQAHPGPCARMIGGRVAVAHACALTKLRPELPRRHRSSRFHVAASERGRIQRISLRADGSVVERQLPGLGLVLRGRTEQADDQRTMAVLEVSRIGRSKRGRVIDRRPVRPRARRHWVLLQAGDDRVIIVAPGVLRRISRPRRPEIGPPRSDRASRRRPG